MSFSGRFHSSNSRFHLFTKSHNLIDSIFNTSCFFSFFQFAFSLFTATLNLTQQFIVKTSNTNAYSSRDLKITRRKRNQKEGEEHSTYSRRNSDSVSFCFNYRFRPLRFCAHQVNWGWRMDVWFDFGFETWSRSQFSVLFPLEFRLRKRMRDEDEGRIENVDEALTLGSGSLSIRLGFRPFELGSVWAWGPNILSYTSLHHACTLRSFIFIYSIFNLF